MKSVFISDLHLSSDHPEIYNAFELFVNNLSDDVSELYILGDLFEVWIGDDEPSNFATDVKNLLKAISARNIQLKIQHGNRDFMLGKRFAQETGAEILADYYLYENYGEKALLMHGDLLCTDDEDYQRFRKKVHNPLYNFCMRNLPLKQRQKIASKWRMQSKEMNKNKSDNIMDVNADSVAQHMEQYAVNTLIHGHTHRPDTHQIDNQRKRIVLGDWGDNIWWVEASTHGIELLSKKI